MLGIAGHMASTAQTYRNVVYDFQGLAIASAVLSLLMLTPIVVIGFLRKGAWLNMNVVEIPVAGFLWVLWFALAILCTSWVPLLYPDGCPARANSITKTFCSEFFAIEGLAFVVWIFLLAYVATMIVICIIGKSRGNTVWLVPADAPNYFEYDPNAKPTTDMTGASMAYQTQPSYPPQQQQMQQQGYQQQQPPMMQQQYTGPQQQQGYAPQMQQQHTGYSHAPSSPAPASVAQV
ncbi:hypothetical protein K435DRAFT_964253 [Dendrothele bispora CBS 962.96]|uniref:MARVEL domain-containing protein n=1 Tax=Dendrothele bispora (strain CBS 962.96) TaxID=1314807 RepID=A0A4S8MCC6_DENBC|nr:hypothetical protein K435DRAFT_964253 [Dendrothele bispora CBS 962.96]